MSPFVFFILNSHLGLICNEQVVTLITPYLKRIESLSGVKQGKDMKGDLKERSTSEPGNKMMKRNLTKVHQTLPRTSQESGLLVNYSYHYKILSKSRNVKLLKVTAQVSQPVGRPTLWQRKPGWKKSLKIESMTVICQQVEHYNSSSYSSEPSWIVGVSSFQATTSELDQNRKWRGDHANRRIIMQFTLGARKDTAEVLGAMSGGGTEGYEWGGRGWGISDAILLPENKRRHAVSSSPSTFSSLSPCMYRPSTSWIWSFSS